MPHSRLTLAHGMIALLVVITWGCNFVVAKEVLKHFATFQTLTLRFMMVLLLLPFFPKPPLPLVSLMKLTAVFSIGHLGCMFGSMYVGLDASLAVIIQQLGIPLVMVLSVLAFKETVSRAGIAGIMLAMAGTMVLAGSPNGITHPLGVMLIMGSALFWAVYSIELKKIETRPNPVALMVWINILTLPVYLPLTFMLEGDLIAAIKSAEPVEWVLLAYIAFIGSLVSHSLWYYLVLHNPMNRVAPFLLLSPLFGAAAAIIFLGDPVTHQLFLGGGMMLAGVTLVILKGHAVVSASHSEG